MRSMKSWARLLLLALVLTVVPAGAAVAGNEGPPGACTPGYWKNHTDNWQEFTPGSLFTDPAPGAGVVFPAELSAFETATFGEALSYPGGPHLAGATRILLRAAAAAFLNAAHDDMTYALDRGDIRGMVNDALASLDRGTIIGAAETLDAYNNALDCSLN